MVVIKKLVKTIEVSHWGNIAVGESYKLANEGAHIVGEFGRVVYNRWNQEAGKNGLRELHAGLPYDTWGI